ncbi:MAG: hypothetical protein HPY66_2895 [Firmicutes bacterium]|nr:hypothetical protein [Bacillota bacterium]
MKGIRCHATIRQKANGNGVKVLSCPDAIGKALERVMKMDTRLDLTVENDTYCCSQEQQGIGSEAVCPECGSRLEHESGCVVCRGCGFPSAVNR